MEYMHNVDREGGESMDAVAGIDLNLVPKLAALLEHRSVTRAAQQVGVTQPAMSHALDRLRRVLGDELLVRVGRDNVLTARGEALIGPVNAIIEMLAMRVLSSPNFKPTTSKRTFRIAAASVAALTVLPSLIATVTRSAPGVRICVEPMSGEDSLIGMDARADVVLMPEVTPTTLPRERLYDERWVVVADSANKRIQDVLSVENLFELPHLVFETKGGISGAHRALLEVAPNLVVQVVVPEFLMIPALLRGTPMIALLQERLASRVAKLNKLRVYKSPIPLPMLHIDMVWNPRTVGDPGISWLREKLLEAVNLD